MLLLPPSLPLWLRLPDAFPGPVPSPAPASSSLTLAHPESLHFFPLYSINRPVIVRLKWGTQEYHGRLVSTDSYMNVQLDGAEEFIDGKSTGTLGQVLIR